MRKKSSKLIITVCVVSILYLIILASSKIIRSLFSPPEILDSKIIGFAQYNGYSFFFDYLFLYEIIFVPIIVIALLYFVFKIYARKNK